MLSLNQLTNYLLNMQLTQLESVSILESKLENKSISSLKKKVKKTLSKVPSREVPEWDVIN